MKYDLMNKLAPALAIAPAAAVADDTPVVSTIFNTAAMCGVALMILVGAVADTDATFTVLLEHGDEGDLSDAVAVPDSELTGSEALAGFTFDDDDVIRKLGYVGSKQYVRATITPVGNTGDAFIAAAWIGSPLDQPAANPPE